MVNIKHGHQHLVKKRIQVVVTSNELPDKLGYMHPSFLVRFNIISIEEIDILNIDMSKVMNIYE
jgi:predicted ATPase